MCSMLTRRDLLATGVRAPDSGARFVHIASLLVHVDPRAGAVLRAAVARMPGAELHETARPDKLALVLESGDDRAVGRAAEELLNITGVLNVSIVAHLIEPATALEEEVQNG